MKKTKKLFLVALLLFAFIPFNLFANSEVKLWINGSYVTTDVAPVIENGRTLVPIRVISENLGLEVDWDKDLKQITVSQADDHFIFVIGQNFYTKDEIKQDLDVAPKIINDRTFVPIRVIAEAFNQEVNWDNVARTVAIGSGYEAQQASAPVATDKQADVKEVKEVNTTNTLVANPNGTNNYQNYTPDTSQGKIKGNRKSKIYHVPGGRDYNKVSQKNVVFFDTEQEAQAAGYRRAKN